MSGIRVLLISWVAFGSLEIKQMAFRVFAVVFINRDTISLLNYLYNIVLYPLRIMIQRLHLDKDNSYKR